MIFGVAVLLSTTVSFIPYALAWDTQKNTGSTDEVKNTNTKINIVNQCHNNAVCIAQVIQNYCSITNDPTTCGQAGESLKLSKGPQGEQGPKGAKGETGEQGPQRPLASITGTLLIKIRVDNTKGGTLSASDFNVGIEGTSPLPQQFQGSEPYTIIQIGKGNYNVSQEIEDGYSLSLDGQCSGSITVGEIKTCTLFNTFAG